ncbi:MAG: DUF1624 domain-containing protein [Thermodesulfovibrionales bacterium]
MPDVNSPAASAAHPARFGELDALRGAAVLMMIVSNFMLDLRHAGFLTELPAELFWAVFARLTAGLFVLIAGIALTLSHVRTGSPGFATYARRGAGIFSLGMLVTAATRVFSGENYVIFGVLHLIGTGIILSYPFLRFRLPALVPGCIMIAAWFAFLRPVRLGTPALLWLGLRTDGFRSLDYTPLFPWFGVMLLGLACGRFVFPGGGRKYRSDRANGTAALRFLGYAGRHSLLVYLLHQPLLLALLYAVRTVSG